MSVLARFVKRRSASPWPAITLNDYIQMLNYGGMQYVPQPQMTLGHKTEEIVMNFQGVVQGALKSNGIVWACIVARAQLFSEAVFKFQRLTAGRPGDLFGTPALTSLENPWPKATTGDLIARMSMDADVTGNAYLTLAPPSPLDLTQTPTIRRLRPDWVTIVGGSKRGDSFDTPLWQLDVEPIGYIYHPGGIGRGKPQPLLTSQVAHFTPWGLDPELAMLGVSPISSIVGDIMADQAMTTHKRMFLENGATPNLVVTLPEAVTPSEFDKWVAAFDEEHEGVMNAYRTIYLGGGADTKVVGADLRQLTFKEVQGHGETRICMALRVEPIIIGASEGLEAASYSNYGQALRAMADLTARPWWRNAAGSLSPLVDRPAGTRLWYDDRDIAFLRDDAKDVADIQVKQATAAELYVRAGYDPETVVKALGGNDLSLLKHSGLASVQLQPLGQVTPNAKPDEPPPAKPPVNTAPVAKMVDGPNLVVLRNRIEYTGPKYDRMVTWTAIRSGSFQCTCGEYVRVSQGLAGCECGACWRVVRWHREHGSVELEELVPQTEGDVRELAAQNGHVRRQLALPVRGILPDPNE